MFAVIACWRMMATPRCNLYTLLTSTTVYWLLLREPPGPHSSDKLASWKMVALIHQVCVWIKCPGWVRWCVCVVQRQSERPLLLCFCAARSLAGTVSHTHTAGVEPYTRKCRQPWQDRLQIPGLACFVLFCLILCYCWKIGLATRRRRRRCSISLDSSQVEWANGCRVRARVGWPTACRSNAFNWWQGEGSKKAD